MIAKSALPVHAAEIPGRGAPQLIFGTPDRSEMETHAYALIHTDDPAARVAELFGDDMKFDVIVGNPPYQMTGGGGGSNDSSIYHLFVEQALRLEPRFLNMVIPARWMAGGRGLDQFRASMLTSGHIRSLVDYQDSSEAFPGVQIKGGSCYFLWDSAYEGPCEVTRVAGGVSSKQAPRDLTEFDIFVRDERGLSILRKVLATQPVSVNSIVSGDTPFGLATNFSDFVDRRRKGDIDLHLIAGGKRGVGYMKANVIRKNAEAINAWKVLLPKAYGAGETFPHQILGQEIVAGPGSACTQTYLMAWPFETQTQADNFASYYRTRFFRFLVSLRKITQDALRSTYSWVPVQTWDKVWTDEELYAKYGITDGEIEFIESIIRPMEPAEAPANA